MTGFDDVIGDSAIARFSENRARLTNEPLGKVVLKGVEIEDEVAKETIFVVK